MLSNKLFNTRKNNLLASVNTTLTNPLQSCLKQKPKLHLNEALCRVANAMPREQLKNTIKSNNDKAFFHRVSNSSLLLPYLQPTRMKIP